MPLFMKRLITVLMAAMLLLTPSCKFIKDNNPFGRKARQAEALQKQQEAFHRADSIKVANELMAQEEARQAELVRIAQQEAEEKARENYHLIVGSFLTPDYAASWLTHCKDMGYNAKIVAIDGGRWNLVSADSYQTARDAWNALPSFLNTFEAGAWVYSGE